MYHPAAGVRRDRQGKLHVRRPFGFYQSSMPGYHVRWHRDINAAINMVKLFRQQYHDGTVPEEFLRGTARDDLVNPESLRYKYRWLAPERRLERWTATEEH